MFNKNYSLIFIIFIIFIFIFNCQMSVTDNLSDKKSSSSSSVSSEDIVVTLSQSTLVFATPDLSQTLVATVTGSTTKTVTWSTANEYIATVNSSGVVTSVSGGTVEITATSTVDSSKKAVCTVTVQEPNRAATTDAIAPSSVTGSNIQIIMCGDSLMRTYETTYGGDQCGWGQVLQNFFTSDVYVDNTISMGGRSSRSFYNEVGRWDVVKQKLAANKLAGIPTFVFIQFAHNDQKTIASGGLAYLTFARNNQNGTVAGTYYDYLERYIVETRELGGIPVFFTPFVRKYFSGSTITEKGKHNITEIYSGETAIRGNYPAAMKEIALKHNVPVIDITTWSAGFVEAQYAANANNVSYIYSTDDTHTRTLGALRHAEAAANGLKNLGILASKIITPNPRLMLDASSLNFGDVVVTPYEETVKNFKMTNYNVVDGTLTITSNSTFFTLSLERNGTYSNSVTIDCATATTGSTIYVKFIPLEKVTYSGSLAVTYTGSTPIIPDWGTSVPGTTDANGAYIALSGKGIESTVYTGSKFTLNVSDLEIGTLENGTTVGTTVSGSTRYFTIVGTPVVDANTKTVDGVTYTKRLKLGGTSNAVSFTMAKSGTVKVICISSSSSENRILNLLDESSNVVGTFSAPGTPATATTVTVAASGTYTLRSAASGINIYYIEVNENN